MLSDGSWTCRKCKIEKPVDDFYKAPKRKACLYPYCKRCTIADVRNYVSDPVKRAERNAYYKARYEAKKDVLLAQMRARYEGQREQKVEDARQWARKNPEKRRLIRQNYKHRRRAQEKGGVSYSELESWKKAQPKICYWCKKKCSRGYVVDHYQPLAKGGKHEIDNLVIACRSCNARKSARDPLEFAREIGRLL